jgi:hypothetical protein
VPLVGEGERSNLASAGKPAVVLLSHKVQKEREELSTRDSPKVRSDVQIQRDNLSILTAGLVGWHSNGHPTEAESKWAGEPQTSGWVFLAALTRLGDKNGAQKSLLYLPYRTDETHGALWHSKPWSVPAYLSKVPLQTPPLSGPPCRGVWHNAEGRSESINLGQRGPNAYPRRSLASIGSNASNRNRPGA